MMKVFLIYWLVGCLTCAVLIDRMENPDAGVVSNVNIGGVGMVIALLWPGLALVLTLDYLGVMPPLKPKK